jgi:HTH-type transcriptional regulator, competence development regulator
MTRQAGFRNKNGTTGAMLEMARKMKGLTLRALEQETGISNGLLSQMETGHVKELSFAKVVKVARALDIKLDLLAQTVRE